MIALFNVIVAFVSFISAALTAAGVIGWLGVIGIILSVILSFITYKLSMHYALHRISKDSSK